MTSTDSLDSLARVVNVAQVYHRSPFRYPGGKTWLVPRIRQWLSPRSPVREFVEPFAGGAIVGLSVAFERLADHVTLLELDPQVGAVWQTILQGSPQDVDWLIHRILDYPMDRANVEATLAQPAGSLREQAFMTILKNRVSHGGCLAQGAGRLKQGENGKGIASRWYPATIAKRIQEIQLIRDRVTFLQTDGVAYMQEHAADAEAVFFVDPPYWVAGTRLYDYSELDHAQLFDMMAHLRGDWLMTYDNAPEIVGLGQAHRFETRLISMQNKNHTTQQELLIGRDFGWLLESEPPQQLRLLSERRKKYRAGDKGSSARKS